MQQSFVTSISLYTLLPFEYQSLSQFGNVLVTGHIVPDPGLRVSRHTLGGLSFAFAFEDVLLITPTIVPMIRKTIMNAQRKAATCFVSLTLTSSSLLFPADVDTAADGDGEDEFLSADAPPCVLACSSLTLWAAVGSSGGRPSDLSLPNANTVIALL